MISFHDLLFKEDEMDETLRETLTDFTCISTDGTHCRRYIKLLGDTIQTVRKITGGKRSGREVLCYSLFFMYAKVLDLWLEPKKEAKWFKEGGSKYFFELFLPRYLEECGKGQVAAGGGDVDSAPPTMVDVKFPPTFSIFAFHTLYVFDVYDVFLC